jgi:hypothetical protein
MTTPRNTSRETLRRHLFVCAGCGCIDIADRRDQLTCSTACRVRAHRNGTLRRLREDARQMDIRPAGILQAAALDRIDPAVSDRIMRREIDADEAQRLVWPTFWRRVAAVVARSA